MEMMNIIVKWEEPVEFQKAMTAEGGFYAEGLFYITQVIGDKENSLAVGSSIGAGTVRQQLKRNSIYWQNFYSGKIMVRFGQVEGDIEKAEAVIITNQRSMFKERLKSPAVDVTDVSVNNIGNIHELPEMI
jgi:hypothetical protein